MANKNYIPKYTYADYVQWEGKWELISGSPVAMSPSPKRLHQKLLTLVEVYLYESFKNQIKDCSCESYRELDWKIDAETVVCPDLMIVCNSFKGDYLEFAPNLVLEVLSPSTQLKDRNTKFSLYESCGVKYYLMADPEKKQVEVFELIDNKYKSIVAYNTFQLTKKCNINIDFDSIFDELK